MNHCDAPTCAHCPALEAVRRLSDRVAALEQQSAVGLSPDDRAVLAPLLPAVAGALLDSVWTVTDLVEHATSDAALGAALDVATEQLGGSRKRLGRLFARADGHVVDGYRVDRVGSSRLGALWCAQPDAGFRRVFRP